MKEDRVLIFNNRNNLSMGLKVVSLPPLQDSTKLTNDVDIDGMDGNLTEFVKYTSDIKQVECDLRGADTNKVIRWLRGKGKVIFGNRTDRFYNAEIVSTVSLNQVVENGLYNFLIQFKCQPFGYLLDGQEPITILNNTTLYNDKADYKSLPIITVYGTGSCVFTINSRSFTITEIGGSITIDSSIGSCYDGKDNKISGKYPYLDVEENVISWTGAGVTGVEITPNWRTI